MIKKNDFIDVLNANKQLDLFGYEEHFKHFADLYDNKKLPNSILLNGQKGLGKSTFAYHLINYILSKNEKNKYDIQNFKISVNNSSFKLINLNSHPNFFLIENINTEKDIKIDQIRNLIKFVSKSTYRNNIKLILIDNAENLNLSSSNAILKILEEADNNTFFFIIHDSSFKILETIKSRCFEFKFFFTQKEKEKIFNKININSNYQLDLKHLKNNFFFETPGNIIKYFISLKNSNIDLYDDNLQNISYFINKYKKEKSIENLSYLSIFVEKFYHNLCSFNLKRSNSLFFNYIRIIKEINNMKKFNLYSTNTFTQIENILKNEKK